MKRCPRCQGQMLPAVAFESYQRDQELQCIQCGYTQETRAPTPEERTIKGRAYRNPYRVR